jgi:RHS repeat-associated protein
MVSQEGTTSFGTYDPEGEVMAFTEPTSTTAVAQNFDSVGNMIAQTPPGLDANGCALGFTAAGSDGYMTTFGSTWNQQGLDCIPATLTGTEDVRAAVQATEKAQILGGRYQIAENVSFDADGRMTVGWNGTICCNPSDDKFTRAYDAESRLLNQMDGSSNLKMKRIYGPDGHIVQIGTTDSNHVLHLETLHWDGNTILFTTNDSGQTDDIKIGSTADYFVRDPLPQAKLTVWDRDYTGHMRGCHNGGGHSGWSQLDPYNANGNPLPSITGCAAPVMYGGAIGQGGAILQPDGDGYWDGFVMIQGARDYDSTLRGWIEPDPIAGDAWNPITQKAYTWNNNNPVSCQDPTGENPPDGNNPSYDPSQGWLEGLNPGFDAGGVDAVGNSFDSTLGYNPSWSPGINALHGWYSQDVTIGYTVYDAKGDPTNVALGVRLTWYAESYGACVDKWRAPNWLSAVALGSAPFPKSAVGLGSGFAGASQYTTLLSVIGMSVPLNLPFSINLGLSDVAATRNVFRLGGRVLGPALLIGVGGWDAGTLLRCTIPSQQQF